MTGHPQITPEELLDKLEAVDPYLPDATLVMLGGGCQANHCKCRELLAKSPEKFIEMMRDRSLIVEHSLKTAITNVLESVEARAASEEAIQKFELDEEALKENAKDAHEVWANHNERFKARSESGKPLCCVFTGAA